MTNNDEEAKIEIFLKKHLKSIEKSVEEAIKNQNEGKQI